MFGGVEGLDIGIDIDKLEDGCAGLWSMFAERREARGEDILIEVGEASSS